MRFTEDCFACLLSRVEYECRLATDDEARVMAAVDACETLLRTIREDDCAAPVIACRIHRHAYQHIGCRDPYRDLKTLNNQEALQALHRVAPSLRTFRDRCLAAVIANTLDYGSRMHRVTDDFIGFFAREFASGFSIDHTDEIERCASRVVYLTDNCGEILFDRLVVESLKAAGSHVTCIVRGAPILNDATLEDALRFGFDRIADDLFVNTMNGIAEFGLNPRFIPPAVSDALDSATLLIAKGMANYESLTEWRDLPPVGYLMSVKCSPIARSVGVPVGSRIALLSR